MGYRRVSTAEQVRSGLGLEHQQGEIERAARQLGLELFDVHTDAGVSGDLPAEDREGLSAAMADLRKGDALVVLRRDRLGRDVIELALVELQVVRRTGARIISASGEGNEDDPDSVFMRRIVDAFSEREKAMIGKRTKAALQAKLARGEPAGNIPFGFTVNEDGKLVKEQREQAIIELVCSLRQDEHTQRGIVSELEDRGVTSVRSGKPLRLAQVQRILSKRGID